jgi:hypothetical protein
MPTQPSQKPAPQDTLYPHIEDFIEQAGPGEVHALFAPVKQGLDDLKGPRAEQSKKIRTAIERTEELLIHLIQVREKLTSPSTEKGKPRK